MKPVYIVIVNWNGWGDTIECLESVMRSDFPNFRVIVCDNGSVDGSLDYIKAWAENRLDVYVQDGSIGKSFAWPPLAKPLVYMEYERSVAEAGGDAEEGGASLVLISNASNLGFAGGNNVGLRYVLARGDGGYVWLLNNDTVVESDALTKMINAMIERPDVGICGSTLLYYDSPNKIQALGGGYYCKWLGLPWHRGRFGKYSPRIDRRKAETAMNYVEGASMLVSKSFLEDIGLMCEDYFLYFEEADWAMRATNRYKMVYAPESVVYHKIGASIGTSSNPLQKSSICDYYNLRNRIRFTRKFAPWALPGVYSVMVLAVILRLLLGQWRRAYLALRIMSGMRTYVKLPYGLL
jgi:GT2 family glycosyltransferase